MSKASPQWTEAEVRVAKAAWVKGLSASRIAAEIWNQCKVRRSSNSVIGWITRNKARHALPERLSPDLANVVRRSKREPAPRIAASAKVQQKTATSPPRPPADTSKPRRRVAADIAEPLNLTVVQLTDRSCRYAVSDGLPYAFCGHPVVPGQWWCPGHARRVYAEPQGAQ